MTKGKWAAAVLAAACLALALWGRNNTGGADLVYALTQPFVWLGAGLRGLSLSGWAGNVLAFLLYGILSLFPLVLMLPRFRKTMHGLCKWLPLLMSGYLFFLLYHMVNPTLIQGMFPAFAAGKEDSLAVEQSMLCMFFYILAIAWWILTVLWDTARLSLHLRRLLYGMGGLMILSVFYVGVAQLKSVLEVQPSLDESLFTTGIAADVWGAAAGVRYYDGLVAVVRFIGQSVPVLILLSALPMAARLLTSLENSFFSEENQAHAAAVANRSRLAVLWSIGEILFTGGLQLLLARNLQNVNIAGDLPLDVLLLSLVMMLLSGYLEKGCAVYRENQMMI